LSFHFNALTKFSGFRGDYNDTFRTNKSATEFSPLFKLFILLLFLYSCVLIAVCCEKEHVFIHFVLLKAFQKLAAINKSISAYSQFHIFTGYWL